MTTNTCRQCKGCNIDEGCNIDKGWTNRRGVEERLKKEDGCEQCNVGWKARGWLRMNELDRRERVGAQAVYIHTSLLSQRVKGQRESFLALSLFKRAHGIEKC